MTWKAFDKNRKQIRERWVLFAPQIATNHYTYEDALRFKKQLISEGIDENKIEIKHYIKR